MTLVFESTHMPSFQLLERLSRTCVSLCPAVYGQPGGSSRGESPRSDSAPPPPFPPELLGVPAVRVAPSPADLLGSGCSLHAPRPEGQQVSQPPVWTPPCGIRLPLVSHLYSVVFIGRTCVSSTGFIMNIGRILVLL